MTDSERSSSGSNAGPRRSVAPDRFVPLLLPPPDGSASTEEPAYGSEEVHSVLTPAGVIESAGRFSRGLGPRRAKILVFCTLGFILIIGILDELR